MLLVSGCTMNTDDENLWYFLFNSAKSFSCLANNNVKNHTSWQLQKFYHYNKIASQINNLAECKKMSLISIISVLCPTQCQEG